MKRLLIVFLLMISTVGTALANQYILIPMDLTQRNHLRAYGVAFHTLQAGDKVNWLGRYPKSAHGCPFAGSGVRDHRRGRSC